MALSPGTCLGPYEIVNPIGAGGMGEVYKARDTRLDRTVAIKVLPAHVASEPDVRQRFEREARAVAALNHPHICTLHDIGSQDGTDFLVMEYLEGETLADRLVKGALPLDQALRYGIEISDALDKAHRAGIVHRDLKPGNIMLTKSGAKLLDFGLAKAGPSLVSSGALSTLPTTPPNLTAQGTILGTSQYMAPEQLEGQEVDFRTDIFAFGAVLYEMLTGKKAFEGKSHASLISAILEHKAPNISKILPLAPPALDRVLTTCLAKDREDRWQTARDLLRELKWIAENTDGPHITQATSRWPAGRRWRWVAIASGLAGVVAALLVLNSESPVTARVSRTAISMPSPGTAGSGLGSGDHALAFSPDGTHLVYASGGQTLYATGGQLYLRSLDSFDIKPVAGSEGASSPFFSPDGQWIGFFGAGQMKKVSIHGGSPVVVTPFVGGPVHASWGANGGIVFSAAGGVRGLFQVPASGGTPEQLTTPDSQKGESAHRSPDVLPDGKVVIFTIQTGSGSDSSRVVAQSLETGERRLLIEGGSDGRYVSSGHLVYMSGGTMMALPLDVSRLQVAGSPIRVVEGVLHATTGDGLFAISATGSLAYVPGGLEESGLRFVWVDRQGAVEPLRAPPRQYGQFTISRDGARVGLHIPDGGRNDVWIYDIASNSFTRLTFEATNRFVIWAPDGKSVAYQSTRTSPPNVFQKFADGTGIEEQLTHCQYECVADAWSPDGKWLVFHENHPVTASDLWVMPVEGFKEARPLLKTPASETAPRFSPNGRWLAYLSNESGRLEVYVQPFPALGGKWQISTEGGAEPRWAPDGKSIFYRTGSRMMAVDVTAEQTFSVGAVRTLFDAAFVGPSNPIGLSAISPDGRFLMLQPIEPPRSATQVNVVLNWGEELKRLVPTTN